MSEQIITPELRSWIIAQAEANCQPEAVLKSMTDAGWNEDVAIAALESTLTRHLADKAAKAELPPAVPVPAADLTDSPLYLDAGDRRVCVLTVLKHPRVVLLGDFLSAEECLGIIDLAKPRMARSLTVENRTGGEEVNADRTSNGMFFQRGENELMRRIEARIARVFHWPEENGEGLQVLQYRPGAEYKPHYDYFDPDAAGTASILTRGGQRVGTVVMYLNEPEKGGGTTFPDIGLEVFPKQGNALFFSYDKAHPSTQSLHGGAPVVAGEKWIATKWLREREFK